jgi:hypothetical protein
MGSVMRWLLIVLSARTQGGDTHACNPAPRLFREQPATQSLGFRRFSAMNHRPVRPARHTIEQPDIGLIDPPDQRSVIGLEWVRGFLESDDLCAHGKPNANGTDSFPRERRAVLAARPLAQRSFRDRAGGRAQFADPIGVLAVARGHSTTPYRCAGMGLAGRLAHGALMPGGGMGLPAGAARGGAVLMLSDEWRTSRAQ